MSFTEQEWPKHLLHVDGEGITISADLARLPSKGLYKFEYP